MTDQREDLYAAGKWTEPKAPASVAICTMDISGRIRFGGSEGYVQAMITAIAERYCAGLTDRE